MVTVSVTHGTASAPLRRQWLRLWSGASVDAPTASPLWLERACATAAAADALRLVAIYQREQLKALVPLCLSEAGHGPLRRRTLRLVAAARLDNGCVRGSFLVARDAEQWVVHTLVEALDGALCDWDRFEISGMPTDSALPALLLANAGRLGVAELGMNGVERRRSLQQPPPERPDGWQGVERADALTLAASDSAASVALAFLQAAGVTAAAALVRAAEDAREQGGQLWMLRYDNRLVAAALLAHGATGDAYVVAAAYRAGAAPSAELALHTLLIEQAKAAGASVYGCWCAAPAELFDDDCPIRSLSVERYSAVNTRNRLWHRFEAWRRERARH